MKSDTQKKPSITRRNAFLYLATAGMAGALQGCGGGGTSTTSSGDTGRATLTITWPEITDTRLVPVAANSITVSFSQNGTTAATQTIARPASGTTSSVSFDSLPAGALTVTAIAYPTTTGSGVAQASASDTVTITAGQSTPVSLTMASTISSVAITPAGPSVAVGATTTLTATAYNASSSIVLTSASTITWSSSNTGVATVSSAGVVTGVAAGSSTITATESESGKTANTTLTVTGAATSCVLIPSETDGPYPLYSVLSNSAMIRSNITESKTGVPLTVKLNIMNINGSCGPVTSGYVYIWHCDKDGNYAGYGTAVGQTFCRGIQPIGSDGSVTFTTVYPGWYTGRITHIHFQVYLTTPTQGASGTVTSQIAFPQAITQAVYNSTLYSARGQNTSVTSFAADNVFGSDTTYGANGVIYETATVTGSVAAGYTATLNVGISR
ncbi:MAG: Ig-like domain-containing protein [Armatimonas sp.]